MTNIFVINFNKIIEKIYGKLNRRSAHEKLIESNETDHKLPFKTDDCDAEFYFTKNLHKI